MDDDKRTPENVVINDLILSFQCEGRERSLSEYKRLFKKHGFAYLNYKPIEGFNISDAMLLRKPF